MSKTKFFLVAIAGLAAASFSFADDHSGDRAACKAERDAMKATIDLDGDGKVSKEERTAHMNLVFDEVSAGSETVTVGELKAHREAKQADSACKKGGGKNVSDDTILTRDEFLENSEKRGKKRKERRGEKRENNGE